MTEEKKLIPGLITIRPYGFIIDYTEHKEQDVCYLAVEFDTVTTIEYENVSKLLALVAHIESDNYYILEIHLKDGTVNKIACFIEVVDVIMNAWLSKGKNVEEIGTCYVVKEGYSIIRKKS